MLSQLSLLRQCRSPSIATVCSLVVPGSSRHLNASWQCFRCWLAISDSMVCVTATSNDTGRLCLACPLQPMLSSLCRRFCTRRIHRIRVAIKLTHGRRTFQNKRITLDNMTEERHFHILLLEMERASDQRPAVAAPC